MPKTSKIYPKLVKLGDILDRPLKDKTPHQNKRGVITYYKKIGKYGFIKSDNSEAYFFHISSFSEFLSEKTMDNLINRQVQFEELTKIDESGKPLKRAVTISFVEEQN